MTLLLSLSNRSTPLYKWSHPHKKNGMIHSCIYIRTWHHWSLLNNWTTEAGKVLPYFPLIWSFILWYCGRQTKWLNTVTLKNYKKNLLLTKNFFISKIYANSEFHACHVLSFLYSLHWEEAILCKNLNPVTLNTVMCLIVTGLW